jgi:hypothetical protein
MAKRLKSTPEGFAEKRSSAAEFSPFQEAYLRRELKKGADQLDCGQYAKFDATSIIAEERRRLANGGASE